MKKRILALILAVSFAVTTFTACSSSTSSDDSSSDSSSSSSSSSDDSSSDDSSASEPIDVYNQEETLSLSVGVLQGFTQTESEFELLLEEKYNVEFELVVYPGWSDGQTKISTLFASGSDKPEVLWWWGMNADFTEWVDAGLLVDVSSYMETYTNIVDYYDSMDPDTMFYAASSDGIYRIPGDVSEPSCQTLWIRQDWLDNLGLEIPTTIDELEEIMRAFTEDDPDGNGVDDTYGLGGDGYDFRSFWPWIQGQDYAHYSEFMTTDDGEFVYGPSTDGTKEWVSQLAELYAAGYITPNIVTDTDRAEEWAKGGFGVAYSWVSYNNPTSEAVVSFYSAYPDAEWVAIDQVVGDNGSSQDAPDSPAAWCYFGITDTCTDPERTYAIFDDMISEENYIWQTFGEQGVHWDYDEDGNYVTYVGDGINESENIGVNLFNSFCNRKDACNVSNLAETVALFEQSGDNSRDYKENMVYWGDPTAFTSWVSYGTDIGDAVGIYLWSVIAGESSIDDWDSYIDTLYSLGLQECLDEGSELYATQQAALEEYLAG